MILSFLFFSLAALCNAVMDKTNYHYHKSIFTKFNRVWWDGEISWVNKYVDGDTKKGRVKWNVLGFEFDKPVQLTDAFHFFKMWMIIFLALSVVTFNGVDGGFFEWVGLFLAYGTIWNSTFSIFYEKIFEKNLTKQKK